MTAFLGFTISMRYFTLLLLPIFTVLSVFSQSIENQDLQTQSPAELAEQIKKASIDEIGLYETALFNYPIQDLAMAKLMAFLFYKTYFLVINSSKRFFLLQVFV